VVSREQLLLWSRTVPNNTVRNMSNPTYEIPTIETDVSIVGAGPAGAFLDFFLGYNGVKGLITSSSSSTVKNAKGTLH